MKYLFQGLHSNNSIKQHNMAWNMSMTNGWRQKIRFGAHKIHVIIIGCFPPNTHNKHPITRKLLSYDIAQQHVSYGMFIVSFFLGKLAGLHEDFTVSCWKTGINENIFAGNYDMTNTNDISNKSLHLHSILLIHTKYSQTHTHLPHKEIAYHYHISNAKIGPILILNITLLLLINTLRPAEVCVHQWM